MAKERAPILVQTLQEAKASGTTHRQVAAKARITPQSLSHYKNGGLPDVLVGQRVAKALGKTVEELWPIKEASADERTG